MGLAVFTHIDDLIVMAKALLNGCSCIRYCDRFIGGPDAVVTVCEGSVTI